MPRHVDGCPCCIDDKQIALLLKTPLREIASGDLSAYASSAFLTVGDVSDFLYFLPRIMEISIRDDAWWPDIEVTAKAIQSAGLKSWPEKRQAALTSLVTAVVAHIMESGEFWKLDGWLCAIARMELEVRPSLEMIEQNSAAVLRYFEDNAESLRQGKLQNAFWELPNKGHDEIVQWFKSEAIRKIPFQAYGYTM